MGYRLWTIDYYCNYVFTIGRYQEACGKGDGRVRAQVPGFDENARTSA